MARKLGSSNGSSSPRRGRGRGKGGGSSTNAPAPAQSNVNDDTIRELCLDALNKKNEHEKKVAEAKSANAEYRAVLKRAKKLGVMPEVITIWLADRKLEVGDVNSRLAQQNRIYRLMRLPVGTQLGMFDEKTTIATHLDNQQQESEREDDPSDAYQAGFNASVAGRPNTENPYDDGTEQHEQWDKGWGFVQKERAFGREPARSAVPQGAAAH